MGRAGPGPLDYGFNRAWPGFEVHELRVGLGRGLVSPWRTPPHTTLHNVLSRSYQALLALITCSPASRCLLHELTDEPSRKGIYVFASFWLLSLAADLPSNVSHPCQTVNCSFRECHEFQPHANAKTWTAFFAPIPRCGNPRLSRESAAVAFLTKFPEFAVQ